MHRHHGGRPVSQLDRPGVLCRPASLASVNNRSGAASGSTGGTSFEMNDSTQSGTRKAMSVDANAGDRQISSDNALREGYVWKLGRKLTGRPKWRKRYFVCTGQALLFVYKTKEEYLSRRDLPEKVVRIDTPDGYMVDTGRMSSNGIELYLNTLCHQSLTTGELKELKFGLQQPEDAYHWRSVSTRSRTPYVDCQHVVLARVSPQCFVDNH
eukprot:1195995-Prorocentrum_minimum.AAC.5